MWKQEEQGKPSAEQEERTLTINRMRVISIALFDAGMRFREGHYREDEELIRAHKKGELESSVKIDKGVFEIPASYKKAIEKKLEKEMKIYKAKQENFGKHLYGYIDGITANMSPEAQKGFDNYATAFGMLADELQKAKNTTQLITLVKMYNEGVFDELFKKAKEDEQIQPTAQEGNAPKETEEGTEEKSN